MPSPVLHHLVPYFGSPNDRQAKGALVRFFVWFLVIVVIIAVILLFLRRR